MKVITIPQEKFTIEISREEAKTLTIATGIVTPSDVTRLGGNQKLLTSLYTELSTLLDER